MAERHVRYLRMGKAGRMSPSPTMPGDGPGNEGRWSLAAESYAQIAGAVHP